MDTPIYRSGRRLGTVPSWTNAGEPTRALVTVTLEIRPAQRPEHHQTINHESLPANPVNISLIGARTRGRVEDGGGQNVSDLRDPDFEPVDGVTVEQVARIADLWDRWHLNEMRAACAHMPTWKEIERLVPAGYPESYGRADVSGWAVGNVVCSAGTGYTYGHAWLYEPVPVEVLDELRDLFPVE